MRAQLKHGYVPRPRERVTVDARLVGRPNEWRFIPDIPAGEDIERNATLEPGDTLLGKYVIERVLGQGGMGVVVAARHVELGELSLGGCSTSLSRARFRSRARRSRKSFTA